MANTQKTVIVTGASQGIGAAVVNLGKSWFTQAFPEYWLFLLGLLFILVTLFLPRGLAGLWSKKSS